MHEFDDQIERTVGTRPVERGGATPAGAPGDTEDRGQWPGTAPEREDPEAGAWHAGATHEIEPLGLAGADPKRDGTGDALRPVPSVAQVGGHPLHPAVVPLPIGALSLAAVSDLAYVATGDRFWARGSQALLVAGLATGAAAAALGAMDFVGREATRRHGEAWLHAGGNLAVMGLSALNLAIRRGNRTRAVLPAGLLLSAISGLLLVVTGWLGGELTFRYRIGVTREEQP